MGRYRVAIIICRTHHSRQIARVAPSNVGTRAAGAYAILRPASRTACERTKSSLSTSRHRSSSLRTGRGSRRTAHEPPQANARRGSNNTFALTAFHSVRTRAQNVGVARPGKRSNVLVDSGVEAPAGGNHERGREETAESQTHPAAHMFPQPEPLCERHPVRDEPQDGKDGEKQREKVGGQAVVELEGKVKLDRSRVRSASPHAPTRTSSPSRRTSYLLSRAAGLIVFAPVLTSYSHPCIGQVTIGPSSSPSPTGPPRCKQPLATPKKRPLHLNKATGYPWTTTTRPLPGGISPAFATLTNTVIPFAEPSPSFEGCESLSRMDRMERRVSP